MPTLRSRRACTLLIVTGLALAAPGLRAEDPALKLPRATPEAQGVSSAALLAFVEEAESKLDALHSLMIVRRGQVIAEGWWTPYQANERHMLYSLSKSFTSTAVGLAVAEGKLTIDDPVLKFFPEEAPAQPSVNLRAMRVRDLLTMSTGHHDDDVRDFPYQSDESVVKQFLARPVSHKPGTFFFYNTPASYMLSAIVQKVSGQPLVEYLKPRLFDPLGIEAPVWDASKQGVSLGGFGLNIRTEDIARFGQLYLQKGQWRGKQLVPASWVELASSRQMSNGSSPTSDWEQGYGFQFWRSRHGFYRGDGAHGQFCLVLPQYDTVIAITSGTRDMGSVMNLVWDRLVPALKTGTLPADAAGHRKLTAKLGTLTMKFPEGAVASAKAAGFAGKRYAFEKNPQGIESVTLEPAPAGSNPAVTLRIGGADQRVAFGHRAWKTGTLQLAGVPTPVAASGSWSAEDTLSLTVIRYRTPFTTSYRLQFTGDRLLLRAEQNVGAEPRVTELEGRAAQGSAAARP